MHPKESAHPIQKWTDRKHTSPIWIALDSPCLPHLTLTQNLTDSSCACSRLTLTLYVSKSLYIFLTNCSVLPKSLSHPPPMPVFSIQKWMFVTEKKRTDLQGFRFNHYTVNVLMGLFLFWSFWVCITWISWYLFPLYVHCTTCRFVKV